MGGGPHGDFSNIKSSMRNPMEDFELFYYNFFLKVKTQRPPVADMITQILYKNTNLIFFKVNGNWNKIFQVTFYF